MSIKITGEINDNIEEVQKLKKLGHQLETSVDNLYLIQQELILNFKGKPEEIAIIIKEINDLESFIWNKKIQYNINKSIEDQVSSDLYSNQLDNMINNDFIKKIESIIKLNSTVLKL